MDLSQLLDSGPEIVETIGGMKFRFSEITLDGMARLQSWIREHVPHPVEQIKPWLDGLPSEERRELLETAMDQARDWPPLLGTAEGAMALLRSELGQVQAFKEGLLVHHPDATLDDAAKIYRVLKAEVGREARNGGESARIRRIYATIFGTVESLDMGPLPKALAPRMDGIGSDGMSSPVGASRS